jgi:DNA-binding IclR family transcriptional regulator
MPARRRSIGGQETTAQDPPAAARERKFDVAARIIGALYVPNQSSWSTFSIAKDVEGKMPAAVKSAARALRIVEFFAEERRRARANEIADRLNLPQSSASVLLNSMVRLGYLDYDFTSRTYQPTLRVAMLAASVEKGPFRDGAILEMMEQLAEGSGFAVGLSTRTDIHVRYICAIQAADPSVERITLALRRYAVWSGSGIALLAGMTEKDVKTLVRKTCAERDPFVQQIKAAQVWEWVESTSKRGYFFSKGLVSPETGAIAMRLPRVFASSQQPVALSVAGKLDAIAGSEHIIADEMRAAISRLEARYSG